jgi:hypothetical protein
MMQKSAPTVKARSNPSVNARAAPIPSSARVCAAAIVLSTASPSAPPISREVFNSPEPRPLCELGSPCIATIVAGTSEKPIPSEVSKAPGSSVVTYVPPGPTPVRSAMPAVAESIPAVITRRGPKRPTTRGASVEARKIESVIGKNATPAWIGS